MSFGDLGQILRYFGQFLSGERLLPKYGYASPGSLYATQLYIEINDMYGLRQGCYYYHPVRHRAHPDQGAAGPAKAPMLVHFVGRHAAIQPIYKNNVREVLEIEAGHMVGLFEEVLPAYGLDILPCRIRAGRQAHPRVRRRGSLSRHL